MMIEIPDDADVVEVNTYRDGQILTKAIYSHDNPENELLCATLAAIGADEHGMWFEDENGLVVRPHKTVQ